MSNIIWQDQFTDTIIDESPQLETPRVEKCPLETYLSIIVPAYNEASCIEKSLYAIEQEIEGITKSYEIIITEDGSSDGTDIIAETLSRENWQIRHLHSKERIGKGAAINNAFLASKGKVAVFMDADLSTNLSCLSGMLDQIESGYDIVIGSRHIDGSKVERDISRTIPSRLYNFLARLIFRDKIHDHQCGFKVLRREILDYIVSIKANGFFFDTELLVRAKKQGYLIHEYPVTWKEPSDRRSKISILRNGTKMGLDLIKLRMDLWKN
jgi:glycosyltransferase involved in cell wall biosynthesis